MCGIIGYISKNTDNIQQILTENLKKLEYRGYDSSGICIICNNNFYTKKSLGHLQNLQKIIDNTKSNIGIAHTRWATHGSVNINNTHPILSQNKTWAVVHNGIIENYLNIKKQLKNVTFCGQTDTEVIPNFLEKQNQTTDLKKIQKLTTKLVGSYALCILHKTNPNTMYLAKKDSPLFVAQNSKSVMASSDPSCFGKEYKSYYTLPQNTIAKIQADSLQFFDFNLNPINVKPQKIGVFEQSSCLGKYKFFAQKEINQIPYVLQNITKTYTNQNYFSKLDKKFLQKMSCVKLIGCGTSYHACQMGALYLQKYCKINAQAYIASEFRYSNPIVNSNTLCVFLSQSGETADTLLCLDLCKKMKAKTVALVNVPYSAIAKNADIFLPLCAGIEIAVMSTKAYNAMLYVLLLLSNHINQTLNNSNSLIENLTFKTLTKICPQKQLDISVQQVLCHEKIFFIGKDQDFITAQEACLKLKEITYINCLALPSGELKHGTISLIDTKSVVFVICTNKQLLSKNLTSASEIKSRGGKTILVTNLKIKKNNLKNIDIIFKFANCPQVFCSNYSIIPFQLLAYKTCLKLGLNPDKPRNLAKSVTVE